jgi:hypothetical protein
MSEPVSPAPPASTDRSQDGAGVYCPSSAPGVDGAIILGVVGGTPDEPRIRYLSRPAPVDSAVLAALDGVDPAEVVRVAAPCSQQRCSHFRDNSCTLVSKIVRAVPEPAGAHQVPPCHLRSRCRWWSQEGVAACRRCPVILTRDIRPSEEIELASDPRTSLADVRPQTSS